MTNPFVLRNQSLLDSCLYFHLSPGRESNVLSLNLTGSTNYGFHGNCQRNRELVWLLTGWILSKRLTDEVLLAHDFFAIIIPDVSINRRLDTKNVLHFIWSKYSRLRTAGKTKEMMSSLRITGVFKLVLEDLCLTIKLFFIFLRLLNFFLFHQQNKQHIIAVNMMNTEKPQTAMNAARNRFETLKSKNELEPEASATSNRFGNSNQLTKQCIVT